jgi:hypothetical protein
MGHKWDRKWGHKWNRKWRGGCGDQTEAKTIHRAAPTIDQSEQRHTPAAIGCMGSLASGAIDDSTAEGGKEHAREPHQSLSSLK